MKIKGGFARATGFTTRFIKQFLYFLPFFLGKTFRVFNLDTKGEPLMGFKWDIYEGLKYPFFKYYRDFYCHFYHLVITQYIIYRKVCQGIQQPLSQQPLAISNIQYIPIVDVRPGDYVLSLNEETQRIEPHRINGLLDMGVKPVFKLTTEDGKTIKTTGNHPYLVRGEITEGQRITIAQQRIEGLTKESDLQTKDFSEEYEFSETKQIWRDGLASAVKDRLLSKEGKEDCGQHANYRGKLTNPENEHPSNHSCFQAGDFFTKPTFKSFFYNFNGSVFGSLFNLVEQINKHLSYSISKFFSQDIRYNNHRHDFLLCHLKDTIRSIICQVQNNNLAFASIPDFKVEFKASWLKVIYLTEGDEIASLATESDGSLAIRLCRN